MITIIQASDDGTWFEGTLDNRTGWFPSNYVQVFEEKTQMENNEEKTKTDVGALFLPKIKLWLLLL
jgi:hypothetical protein